VQVRNLSVLQNNIPMNIINQTELKHNAYYLGESYSTFCAKWNATINLFEYVSDSTYQTVKCIDPALSAEEDVFVPLFEISKPRVDILKTGQLVKI